MARQKWVFNETIVKQIVLQLTEAAALNEKAYQILFRFITLQIESFKIRLFQHFVLIYQILSPTSGFRFKYWLKSDRRDQQRNYISLEMALSLLFSLFYVTTRDTFNLRYWQATDWANHGVQRAPSIELKLCTRRIKRSVLAWSGLNMRVSGLFYLNIAHGTYLHVGVCVPALLFVYNCRSQCYSADKKGRLQHA